MDLPRINPDVELIDPTGEVMIIIDNANVPFVVWDCQTSTIEMPSPPTRILRPLTEATEKGAEKTQDERPQDKFTKYRVSAKHLTLASPVFEAALKGRWKEGSTLQDEGFTEIHVEGWDPTAFGIVINVIHGKLKRVPRRVDVDLLARIAVIVDYYGCHEPLSIFADTWIGSIENTVPNKFGRNVMLWLVICHVFGLRTLFRELSVIAVKGSTQEIESLGLPFPLFFIDRLNDIRNDIIGRAIKDLYDQICHLTVHDNDGSMRAPCFSCTSLKLGALIKGMIKIALAPSPVDPFDGLSYDALMERVMSMDDTKGPFRNHGHESCGSLKDMLDQVASTKWNDLGEPSNLTRRIFCDALDT